MNHPLSKILALPFLLLMAALYPAKLHAQSCSGQEPARFVPGPPPNHDPDAPDIDLWLPEIFRPGLTDLTNRRLPAERDSTGWDSLTIPGFSSGHEIFQGMDVLGDYMYAAYNAGFSIWDIATDPEKPDRVKVRDGWHFSSCQQNADCGPFLSFPGAGEVDFLVEDIDVMPAPGSANTVYIAVSGRNPVGISLWRFNTSNQALTAIYQDTTLVSRQVRLITVDGVAYAFSSYGNGLAVYNMTRAIAIAGCLEETGSDCPGVYQGNLGTIDTGRYLDVFQRPNGEILVAASNGNISGQGLELWRLTDPSNPGSANRLFAGLNNRTFGVALFNYEGNDYLAALERTGSLNVIKIFNINSCSGTGACNLGSPVFDDIGVPPRLSDQFLTYSTSRDTPFLYYGLFGGFGGPKVEQLLNLTTLGRPVQTITEMTDGGSTYFDNCANTNIGYWAWYYPGNDFGPKNMTPRIGKFNPDTNIFYRAAGGILDVHVWEGGIDPPSPTITTTVNNPDPQSLYWMTDDITFEGEGSNGCNPTGIWTWTSQTPSDVNAVTVSEVGNQVTLRFECTSGGRCNDSVVSVSGANSDPSCAGAEQKSAFITVKDPSVELTSINPSSGRFTQCENVDFTAGLVGRGPVDLNWDVRRDPAQDAEQIPQQTFDDTVDEEDLSAASPTFTWNTEMAIFAGIFADGFESGDTSAWPSTPTLLENFVIQAELGSALKLGGGSNATAIVELASVAGDPAFDSPAIESSTEDNSTFDFQANTLPGTASEWFWKLEDNNGPNMCTFGSDTGIPCFFELGQEISHTWTQQSGTRRVEVSASNCQSTVTTTVSTTVTVEATEPVEVTSFELDRTQSSEACNIDFDCLNDLICVCGINETIFFEVTSTGDPDVYDFDWDGNGSFEDVNNPADSTEYTNVYTQAIGQVKPGVRARRGSASAERDLLETLDIRDNTEPLTVNFELDRAQSATACEIDFDCINDLICVCFTDQTIFFEVTSTGDPDVYDFDWNGNGSYEDTNNSANGTEFTFTYPTAIGLVKPAVRARRGSATPAESDLRETLDIQDGSGVPLNITRFELDRDASSDACEIDFDCVNDLICVCFTGQSITVNVAATGDPDFYDFDWDGNGSYEDTGNSTSGTDFSFTFSNPIGQIRPGVRARRSGATAAERDLREILDIQDDPNAFEITSFELDRAQSASACEIDFDCLTDLICVCHINETIFFEVTAIGGPTSYDFDWDGNGTFEDTGNSTSGTEFTNIYTQAIGQITPAVRARRGGETLERDLRETLDIQP